MEYLTNKYFLIALTFLFYLGAQLLQRRTGIRLFNPILVAVAGLIGFLLLFKIDYSSYREGGEYIEFWLKPAVVALGVPLYKQLSTIRRQLLPLIISEMAGCVAGIVSVVLLAERLGCRLLTADQKLVHFAQSRGLETSGLLWLTDEMVEKGVVRPQDMIVYLNHYLDTNKRAPEKEVSKRITQYKNTRK